MAKLSLFFSANLLCYVLRFDIGYTQIITKGTYFKEIQVDETKKNEDKANSHYLNEKLFWCSRSSFCQSIGKLKNENIYRTVQHNEEINAEKYDTVVTKVTSGFQDCKEAQREGMNTNGVIDISWKNGSSFRGYCNMATDSGGWAVFQRRVSEDVRFFRNWTDYVNGFGKLDGSFWLGLEAIHEMTKDRKVTLRIDLKNKQGKKGFAKYENFKVLSSKEKYKLQIGSYQGDIGDALLNSNNMYFTTSDQDNDKMNVPFQNCASRYQGPWWHNDCFVANLNNHMPDSKNTPETAEAPGAAMMSWYTWENKYGGITYSEMKLRAEN